MLNKRIRSLIDEIFSDMRMTAENLALRDELMANAQARYDDALLAGKSEEAAFAEVAGSLGDVRALLREMNAAPRAEEDAVHSDDEAAREEEPAAREEPDFAGEEAEAEPCAIDLGEAFNKAFSALGDMGRQLVPQAKKLARQADEATGGALRELGKAVNKGMQDAQRSAEETIDRLSGKKGELTIDFSDPKGRKSTQATAEQLREEAKDIRAQAELKQVTGDQEGARELRARAYELETRADAIEQAQAMDQAQRAAGEAADDYLGADGELDEGAFAKAVDDMVREAQDAAQPDNERAFPAAGLRTIDIKVDADEVWVTQADGPQVLVRWMSAQEEAAPVVEMGSHTLSVRRPNPDVFKTFFSVFATAAGRITVSVPRGYAADYEISTTSGDVWMSGIDAGSVKVNTVSGDVRLEPDPAVRAGEISVTTISGDVTVSACAGDVAVNTVSGEQFVSCDAGRVDMNAVSGSVRAEGASDEWEISAVSADALLLCTVAPTRQIKLNTVSGDVRVALPGDVRGFVAELSGMGGHIVNEFGPNRYGTCALPIHMDTMSGDLTITRL